MKQNSKLGILEKKVKNAVTIFTKTIGVLEKANKEYEKVKSELVEEVRQINATTAVIDAKLEQNNKLLNNFKQLLK